MRSIDAHARLIELGVSSFSTNDAGAKLRVTRAHASQILRRLASAGHVVHLGRGRWAFPSIKRFALPEALTRPAPSYVSFHSALFHHGLIDQIPQVVYAATLAPTRRVQTPLGVISLHQLAPEMFWGYEYDHRSDANIASPEKALVDFFYLKPARSQLFRALPELDLPRSFNRHKARKMAERIPAVRRRAMVLQLLEQAG